MFNWFGASEVRQRIALACDARVGAGKAAQNCTALGVTLLLRGPFGSHPGDARARRGTPGFVSKDERGAEKEEGTNKCSNILPRERDDEPKRSRTNHNDFGESLRLVVWLYGHEQYMAAFSTDGFVVVPVF